MVREDIVTGLRNALERGYSMEDAKRTLLNSGYSQIEVQEAANFLQGHIQLNAQPQQPQMPQQPYQKQQLSPLPTQQYQISQSKPENKSKTILILLISLLLILIIILTISLIFKDNIVSFFDNLF